MFQQLVSELVLEKEGVWSKLKNKSSQNVFLNIPSCRGRQEESTGENPVKNGRPSCPHEPTRSYDNTAYVRRRAPRVFLAQIPATEPGWPAKSSASQQPDQQFCTVIRHVISPVSKTRQHCHTSNKYTRICHVIKSRPGLITWMPRHLATSSIWVLIQCFADTILAWHVASSTSSVDPKLWLIRFEPSKVRFGWS